MRKQIINATEPSSPGTSEEWLNLEEMARVEVSSEDPQTFIESAFKHVESLGWCARQLSERSSSPCAGQIAKQVLLERSFDSNGTLIPRSSTIEV
jgi:hypothetical protein